MSLSDDERPKNGVSVVIPVYGSEMTIEGLCERLVAVLRDSGMPHEVVLVNDCSPDQVVSVIENLQRKHPCIRLVSLMRNFGQHNAVLAGIRLARYAVTVTMDDDLQHPPEAIPLLLAHLDQGFDVVYGCPKAEKHGFFRDMASVLMKGLIRRVMGVENARDICSFRVFRTQLRLAFADYCSPYVFIDAMLTWGTAKFSSIQVEHGERAGGKSGYSFNKLFMHLLNMVTCFSVFPLHVASCIGIATILFSLCVFAYIMVIRFMIGREVPGFAFLGTTIAVFSGVQLFALGVVGEYLARVHVRLMNRPSYVTKPQ
jgi:undecaprenyl-phosphate 4-deoxy-4-formamido-L-arabinose transferase